MAFAAAALAGCGGDNDGNDDGDSPVNEDRPRSEEPAPVPEGSPGGGSEPGED